MKINFMDKLRYSKNIKHSKQIKMILFTCILSLTIESVFAEKHSSSAYKEKSLTLIETLKLVLKGNNELKAYSFALRASDAEILQAKLLPNPSFNYQIENIGGTGQFNGTNAAEITYTINQLIELGGKRSARTSFANRLRDSKQSNYKIKRLEVFADSIIKFFHVAADQERLKLAKTVTKQAKNILTNIKKRAKAGKSSILEVNKALVILSQFSIEEEHAEHELETAKIRLASNWGDEKLSFVNVKANLFKKEDIPTYKKLIENINDTPTIERWLIEEKVKQAKVELEEANQIPDVTLGVSYRRLEATNDDAAVMQFTVPLPFFNRNQHNLYKAKALSQKVQNLTKNSKNKIKELIFSLYKELVHSQVELKESEQVILPAAESALRAATDGFNQGKFSYLDLADAQKIFFNAKKNYINSALKYQERLVEIEKLTGVRIRSENSLKNFKDN